MPSGKLLSCIFFNWNLRNSKFEYTLQVTVVSITQNKIFICLQGLFLSFASGNWCHKQQTRYFLVDKQRINIKFINKQEKSSI